MQKILNDAKEMLITSMQEKTRDNLEKDMENLKSDRSKCTGVEATARNNKKVHQNV